MAETDPDTQPYSHPGERFGADADSGTWEPGDAGVLSLPSGRLIRGRALRRPLLADGGPEPAYAVYLLGKEPPPVPWEAHWLRWPDFRLPADRAGARAVLTEAWRRAAGERVEIACFGGRGRTGTALACVAVLDGVPPEDAVAYVRRHYDRHAVETPWQRAYVRRFGAQD
ncbi:protein phosphatase [Streptomyces sp. NBC_01007]|nr:protein phosphatase [Streptomyces sp. NBC_01007]